jgi:hexulose-6-phosphate isomerase
MKRRTFLSASLAATGAAMIPTIGARAAGTPQGDGDGKPSLGPIYKTLKIGMVGVPGNLTDKFAAVVKAGFDGVELDSPGFDVDQAKAAIKATGLPVDGTVCSSHWQIRHTSADAEQRRIALDHLQQAITDTHAVGGHTVLLVVGRGDDGEESELIERSVENISKAIPLAAKLGVVIAIENVWNQFLYDHDGGADQSAEKYASYVDMFQSPWVGMQYDIGNHWKYGDPAEWIRTLGKRIVKLDAKGFSRAENRFTKVMTDGDIKWDSVRQALADIDYVGWAAAEVGGGGPEQLAEISQDMDRAFGIR